MVSLCFARVRSSTRGAKGDEEQTRDVQVDKMEAGLAGGSEKPQSRQSRSASRKLPLRLGSLPPDSLVRAAWGIGGCTSHLPRSAPGGGGGGGGGLGAVCPPALQARGGGGSRCRLQITVPGPSRWGLRPFRTPPKFKLAEVLSQVRAAQAIKTEIGFPPGERDVCLGLRAALGGRSRDGISRKPT